MGFAKKVPDPGLFFFSVLKLRNLGNIHVCNLGGTTVQKKENAPAPYERAESDGEIVNCRGDTLPPGRALHHRDGPFSVTFYTLKESTSTGYCQ